MKIFKDERLNELVNDATVGAEMTGEENKLLYEKRAKERKSRKKNGKNSKHLFYLSLSLQ